MKNEELRIKNEEWRGDAAGCDIPTLVMYDWCFYFFSNGMLVSEKSCIFANEIEKQEAIWKQ